MLGRNPCKQSVPCRRVETSETNSSEDPRGFLVSSKSQPIAFHPPRPPTELCHLLSAQHPQDSPSLQERQRRLLLPSAPHWDISPQLKLCQHQVSSPQGGVCVGWLNQPTEFLFITDQDRHVELFPSLIPTPLTLSLRSRAGVTAHRGDIAAPPLSHSKHSQPQSPPPALWDSLMEHWAVTQLMGEGSVSWEIPALLRAPWDLSISPCFVSATDFL